MYRKPPPHTAMTNARNLQQKDNIQSLIVPSNPTSISNEEEMKDATGKVANTDPSFKDALVNALGNEGLKDANWGDLLNEEFPENKWYKNTEETVSKALTLNLLSLKFLSQMRRLITGQNLGKTP